MSKIVPLHKKLAIRNRVNVPTEFGRAEFVTFKLPPKDEENLAIIFHKADQRLDEEPAPFVRVHSSCLTGEALFSTRCDCKSQLTEAFQIASTNPHGGIILYLKQEGRGIGLRNKLDAYQLQDQEGLDTFDANTELGFPVDDRRYDLASQMLKLLGVNAIRLHTGNSDKAEQLDQSGILIVEQIPTTLRMNVDNEKYLQAKSNHDHHFKSNVKFVDEAERVLFLDMDGVVVTLRSHMALGQVGGMMRKFDPIAIGYINRFCAEFDMSIVVSSVWRKSHNVPELLVAEGVTVPFHKDWKTGNGRTGFRGQEIQDWLEAHPEAKHYSIWDDDRDFFDYQTKYHLLTSSCDGISHEGFIDHQSLMRRELGII
jgi:GTP cyclohydrolase II